MTKFFLIAAGAVLIIAGGPVVAREPGTIAAPAEQPGTTRARQPRQRYCVVDTITGSRIPYRTCRTHAEWLKAGFDPLHPDK